MVWIRRRSLVKLTIIVMHKLTIYIIILFDLISLVCNNEQEQQRNDRNAYRSIKIGDTLSDIQLANSVLDFLLILFQSIVIGFNYFGVYSMKFIHACIKLRNKIPSMVLILVFFYYFEIMIQNLLTCKLKFSIYNGNTLQLSFF